MIAEIDVEEMKTKMRMKDTDDEQSKMSKQISYVVRYGAPEIDKVEYNSGHYYKLKQMLALNIFEGVSEETFLQVVDRANTQKMRYEIRNLGGEPCIKAAGQHGGDPLERVLSKMQEKEEKRLARESGYGSRDANRLSSTKMSEEEFARKWSLDPLARQKLMDLPPEHKQNAMLKFAPNSMVPNEDYSKLFVAFCKRFAVSGSFLGGGGGGGGGGGHKAMVTSPKWKRGGIHPMLDSMRWVADAMPFCPGVPWYSLHDMS